MADITYIPTREGMLYLATVLDLGSRRCVGWAMQDTLEVELALRALQMENIGLLLDRGVNINANDCPSITALHWVASAVAVSPAAYCTLGSAM